MASTGKFIGGIKFGVSMDTKKLNRDVKKARGTISRFVGSVKKAAFSVQGLGAALSAGAFIKFTSDAFSAIDSLAKVSDKLGVTTESLAGLRLAADETGAGVATLDKGLLILTKTTGEAAQGVGLGVRAFKVLGLNARELNKLSPDKQFIRIAAAVSKLTNKQDQLTVSTQLFGTRGASLVNTLRIGKEGMDEAAQAAKDLGLAVSRGAAREVEKSIDAFNRFKSSIGGIFRDIAVEVAPIITDLSNKLRELIKLTRTKPKRGGFMSMLSVSTGAIGRFFSETARGIGLSGITNDRGFFDALRRSAVVDVGPRSTTAGPNNRQFQTPASIAAFEAAGGTGDTFRSMRKSLDVIAMQGKNALAGLKQGASGVAGLPALRLLPAFLSNLSNLAPEIENPKAQQRTRLGTQGNLSFTQAGSAESFRQRAAIRNANELKKLDQKRNTTLTQIKDQLTKNPVVLLQANF